MLHELPWLPEPAPSDREALKGPLGDGFEAVARLAGLSGRRWTDTELASIGRKLRKLVNLRDPDWRAEAKKRGFTPFTLLMFSSNTAAHLADPLAAVALSRGILLDLRVVEYQEPEGWLAANKGKLAEEPIDAALLALDRASLRLKANPGASAEAEEAVKAAVDRVLAIAARITELTCAPAIVETLPGNPNDPQGSVDAWLPGSPRRLAGAFNEGLAAATRSHPHLVFDVAGIAELVGQPAWNAGRLWYTAKMPFSASCIGLYAHRLVALLSSLTGRSRRVLVLDLDNTVWGGVIGDEGVAGIVIGGNSARGKAHADIQKMALDYKARGVLLCVASKNTHEVAIEAFRTHPEMLIREDDVTLFSINWENKAANIRNMSEALNLGLDSFVFVDDSPVERKQVREALPGVAVPELPDDPSTWLPIIQAAAYFEQHSFSAEDQKRADFYKNNAKRVMLHNAATDERSFLESLNMVMTVAPFDELGRKRIAQLISKSNQSNLTTHRYSEAHVKAFETDRDVMTMQIRLEDIFGDNGMISVIICRKGSETWEVDTWLMSCRVIGRGVERVALNIIAQRAREAGAVEVRGKYIPTAKNGMVADHYAKLGFTKVAEASSGETEWALKLDGFKPANVPMRVIETDRTGAAARDLETVEGQR